MQPWIFQAITVFFAVLQVIILVAIKLNDMKHIESAIKDLKIQLIDLEKKILEHESRLSRLEGKINGKYN